MGGGGAQFHAERQTDRHTDGRTEGHVDMTKPKVVFRNFTNAPKKEWETPLQ